ncbi:MAG: DUF1738 domain-containing protein, partial [Clostridia bacterium]|nr:DUF1738 domain-containing protein [Clostridia bacterium]
PWINLHGGSASVARNHVTGRVYSFLNQMLLGEPGEYLTFKQCMQKGGKIKKGAKGRFVVFWKPMHKDVTDKDGKIVIGADGKPKQQFIPYLQYHYVYHIRDTEDIKPRFEPEIPENDAPREPVPQYANAEKILQEYLQKSGVTLTHSPQNRAFYRPSTDEIILPTLDMFRTSEGYYATVFHEAVHSTGHPSRLNRIDKKAGFGTETYSKEELVAEIGSAAILNQLDISTDAEFQNSAAYIESWLHALRNDKRMIVSAAGKADKAVAMILGEEKEE